MQIKEQDNRGKKEQKIQGCISQLNTENSFLIQSFAKMQIVSQIMSPQTSRVLKYMLKSIISNELEDFHGLSKI